MTLSPDKIEAIRQRAEISEVIGAVVTLKKQGSRQIGLCPFHSEKSPSFSVSPDKGLYYCFGCHAGGDVFSFVMRHQGIDFQDAARLLAERVGVQVEAEPPAERKRKKISAWLARVNGCAHAFFVHALKEDAARTARAYLSERGVPVEVSAQWGLGFGGTSQALLAYLKAKNVAGEAAARAGFLSEDGRRSLFEGRIIFPIRDERGLVVGFGGRRIGEGSGPKYVNSRETPAFSKRTLLFGWSQAEQSIRQSRRVVLVEGYMDVLACHRAGVTAAVAALGTAFTPEHAKRCGRLAKEAVLLFDGDPAGTRACQSAATVLLRAGIKPSIAVLEQGEDPDEALRREGTQALRIRIDSASPAVEHFIERAIESQMSVEDKAEAARSLAPLFAAMGKGLEWDLYVARLAEKVGVSPEQMSAHLRRVPVPRDKINTNSYSPTRPTLGPPAPLSSSSPPEAADQSSPLTPAPTQETPSVPTPQEIKILEQLALYPSLRPRVSELSEFASDPMRVLLDELAASEEPLEEVLGRHLPNPRWVQCIVRRPPIEGKSTEDLHGQANRTLEDVLSRLKAIHIERAHEEMMQELRLKEERGEDTEDLLRRIRNLAVRKRELRRPRVENTQGSKR